MRRLFLVVVVVLGASCAHKQKPAPPPPAPPPPKGDLLRFKAKKGDAGKSRVKLLIEQELATAPSEKRPPKPVTLSLSFGEEEQVDTVGSDGAAVISARLVDAVGQAGGAADQKMVDDMALALDELKIQFKRQPRGEVVAVALSGLRRPLDESTARQVVNAMFGAQRGQIFPEENIDVAGSWKVTLPIPATAGFAGEVRYDYTYAKKAGAIATVVCEGRADGKKGDGAKLTSKSSAEYRFDIDAGHVLGSTVDQLTQVEGTAAASTMPSGVRQHLRVEWSSEGEAREKQE
jgi:hypothetical protein